MSSDKPEEPEDPELKELQVTQLALCKELVKHEQRAMRTFIDALNKFLDGKESDGKVSDYQVVNALTSVQDISTLRNSFCGGSE